MRLLSATTSNLSLSGKTTKLLGTPSTVSMVYNDDFIPQLRNSTQLTLGRKLRHNDAYYTLTPWSPISKWNTSSHKSRRSRALLIHKLQVMTVGPQRDKVYRRPSPWHLCAISRRPMTPPFCVEWTVFQCYLFATEAEQSRHFPTEVQLEMTFFYCIDHGRCGQWCDANLRSLVLRRLIATILSN